MDRLQKVIAQAGIASRRKAEKYIADGRVRVNDQVIRELGTKVTQNDKIEVDGVPVEREAPVYFLFYKPTGVISSVKDPEGRKVVTDFFKEEIDKRIFPVGRLDYNTSGLLVLTNDGEFANLLTHPKFEINKTYIVKINGILTREALYALRNGVKLEDGMTAPAIAKVVSENKKTGKSILKMTIHEGKNRQIRRMIETLGYKVEKLKREQYAFLDLKGLNPGEYRELSPHEIKQLRELALKE